MTSPDNSASRQLIGKGRQYFVPNYKPREIVLDRGRGARLWDLDGNEYIDLGTGISVNSLGHQHPELVQALEEQGRRLWHASNIYFNAPAVRLAEELVTASPFARRVFFCNSGAEANEAAIKLARKHASLHYPPDKRNIITFTGSFHGRTLATVTATAQPQYQQGFEPLPGGFVYCPFNDPDAVAAAMANACAVLVEPIQGEGGVMPAAPGFLRRLRELCDQHDALLMLDEVQCGIGRSGRLYAHQWEEGVVPDVVTLAKALGGGLPMGAMLVGPRAADVLQFGSHGSTFGGNPLACAAARVVWRTVQSPELLDNVARQGGV
ncbi:MAG: acetylornithine transaminase, partial [Pseudomonadota bacterium]|nr:acetylornithine transaminase [Pseudomonadota bacterium]